MDISSQSDMYFLLFNANKREYDISNILIKLQNLIGDEEDAEQYPSVVDIQQYKNIQQY